MRGQPWTSERLTLLRELWASGETAEAIAARIGGISRAAILGKIFRLRLAPPKVIAARAPKRRRSSPKQRQALQSAKAPAKTWGKSLLELSNESCRWVVEAGVKWTADKVFSQFH